MLLFGSGYSVVTYNYNSPTLSLLRNRVMRALRDVEGRTFIPEEIDDYIRAGLIEVGAIYPKEVIETFDMLADTYDYPPASKEIFRVEVVDFRGYSRLVDPSNGEQPDSGWDCYAGHLFIPRWVGFTPESDTLRVWGYAPRDSFNGDDDVLDVDAQAEQAVLTYAQLLGYRSLLNSRAKFGQWQAEAGNTDVSMNQLEMLVSGYDGQWSDARKRLKLLRRV